MKVAIPLFGDEVSPRFGYSRQFLIASIEDGRLGPQEVQEVGHLAPWQLVAFLTSLGVAKVICGGVHPRFQEEMDRCGIEVIWGVIGPAAEALSALAKGTLRSDQFVCPGRHRRGFGRGRGRSGGPGGGGGRGGPRRQGRGGGSGGFGGGTIG